MSDVEDSPVDACSFVIWMDESLLLLLLDRAIFGLDSGEGTLGEFFGLSSSRCPGLLFTFSVGVVATLSLVREDGLDVDLDDDGFAPVADAVTLRGDDLG